MAALTKSVSKKWSKGRTHVPRAPKPRTAEQLLADEQAAHQATCGKLGAALARLKIREQDCSNSMETVQTLQQQMSGLSAELQQKQTDLELVSVQLAGAQGTAAALDASIASLQQQLQDKDASLLAVEAFKQAALNEMAAQQVAAHAATSKLAVLQEQLTVTQDSLSKLQNKYQAAQGNLAVQKAATAVAEATITGLELKTGQLTVSLSDMQRRFELVSADLAAHKAAARTADFSIESLHVQLQYSSSRCAELHAANDDLAWQASVAAAAASNRVLELEGELQDALAKLQQLQLANEASLEILTDIAANNLVLQAASEFAMGQQLKAADNAAKAQRDKYAIKDAEVRACRWQLAKSEAGTTHLQLEVAQLQQQLAVAAAAAVQLEGTMQAVVLGQTAATNQIKEAETATQVVKRQLSGALQKLAAAQNQLFDWACAAAATELTPNDLASNSPDLADGVCSRSAPTVLQSKAPKPTNVESSQYGPIEARWKLLTLQPFTNVPHQQIPVSPYQGVPGLDGLTPSLVSLAVTKVPTGGNTSKSATQAPNLRKSLKQVLKRFGAFCSCGSSKGSVSPQALGEIHHNSVLNSSLSSQRMSKVPSCSMSLHGTADHGGYSTGAAAQERYCAAAEAAADVTGTGITGSTAVAAVSRLSRWGSAAAGAVDAACNSPGTSDTTVTYNITASQSGTAEGSVADAPVQDIATTYVYDDVAVDKETAIVTVIEWSAGRKSGPMVAPAMTDVGAFAS